MVANYDPWTTLYDEGGNAITPSAFDPTSVGGGGQYAGTGKPPAPDRSGQIGLNPSTGQYEYFTYGPYGEIEWSGAAAPAQNPHPGSSTSSSSSYNVSQSYQDPAALALQRDQLQATVANQQAQLAATIQDNQANLALKQQAQDFLQLKEQYAETTNDRQMAQQAQQQQFTNQLSIADLQLKTQQAAVQYQQFNQSIAEQANRDAVSAAAQPIDYGKYASWSLLHNGWGQQGPVGANDFRTPSSLAPLQNALNTRTTAQNNEANNPFTGISIPSLTPTPNQPTPNLPQQPGMTWQQNPNGAGSIATAPGVAGAWGSNGDPQYNAGQPFVPPPGAAAPAPGMAATNTASSAPPVQLPASTQNSSSQGGATNQALNLANATMLNTPGMPSFVTPMSMAAKGGIESGAYISGEKGPEINIPLPSGKTMVLNNQQAKAAGINLDRIVKMATGGIFDSPLITGTANNGASGDTSQALDFSNSTFDQALSGTPWAAGGRAGLPSPVYASSPGFSPTNEQLLAGLAQTGGMLPAAEYGRQAQDLSPVAYTRLPIARQAPIGRTA